MPVARSHPSRISCPYRYQRENSSTPHIEMWEQERSTKFLSIVNLSTWPFKKLVIAFICWNIAQALLQIRYRLALGYATGVPRPLWAKMFIGGQGILVMLV